MSGPIQFSFANAENSAPGARSVQFGGQAEDVEDDTPFVPTPRKPAPKAATVPKPLNVVALAKARLREVKRDLRRMSALEKERAELERLIAAAEGAPVRSADGKVVGIRK